MNLSSRERLCNFFRVLEVFTSFHAFFIIIVYFFHQIIVFSIVDFFASILCYLGLGVCNKVVKRRKAAARLRGTKSVFHGHLYLDTIELFKHYIKKILFYTLKYFQDIKFSIIFKII